MKLFYCCSVLLLHTHWKNNKCHISFSYVTLCRWCHVWKKKKNLLDLIDNSVISTVTQPDVGFQSYKMFFQPQDLFTGWFRIVLYEYLLSHPDEDPPPNTRIHKDVRCGDVCVCVSSRRCKMTDAAVVVTGGERNYSRSPSVLPSSRRCVRCSDVFLFCFSCCASVNIRAEVTSCCLQGARCRDGTRPQDVSKEQAQAWR